MVALTGCYRDALSFSLVPSLPEPPAQTLGTLCLWMGWFGFNGVSTLVIVGAGEVAARASELFRASNAQPSCSSSFIHMVEPPTNLFAVRAVYVRQCDCECVQVYVTLIDAANAPAVFLMPPPPPPCPSNAFPPPHPSQW